MSKLGKDASPLKPLASKHFVMMSSHLEDNPKYLVGPKLTGSKGSCGRIDVAYARVDLLNAVDAAESSNPESEPQVTTNAQEEDPNKTKKAMNASSLHTAAAGHTSSLSYLLSRRKMVAMKQIEAKFAVEAHALGLLKGAPYVLQMYDLLAEVDTPKGPQKDGTAATSSPTLASSFCITTEFCAGGDLRSALSDWAESNPSAPWLPEHLAKRIFAQIAIGLFHLKRRRIIHRDLKLDNVFLTHFDLFKSEVRIADFGLSKLDYFFKSEIEGSRKTRGSGKEVALHPLYEDDVEKDRNVDDGSGNHDQYVMNSALASAIDAQRRLVETKKMENARNAVVSDNVESQDAMLQQRDTAEELESAWQASADDSPVGEFNNNTKSNVNDDDSPPSPIGAGSHRDVGARAKGNLFTMCPERLVRARYSYQSDVWSAGVLLYSMLCGIMPWSGAGVAGTYEYLIRVLKAIPVACLGDVGSAILQKEMERSKRTSSCSIPPPTNADLSALFEAQDSNRPTSIPTTSSRKPPSTSLSDPDGFLDDDATAAFFFPYPVNMSLSSEAKDLVLRMLTVDPSKRITIEEILSHPWLNLNNKEGASIVNQSLDQVSQLVAAVGCSFAATECPIPLSFRLVQGPYPSALAFAKAKGVPLVHEDDLIAITKRGLTEADKRVDEKETKADKSLTTNRNRPTPSPPPLSDFLAVGRRGKETGKGGALVEQRFVSGGVIPNETDQLARDSPPVARMRQYRLPLQHVLAALYDKEQQILRQKKMYYLYECAGQRFKTIEELKKLEKLVQNTLIAKAAKLERKKQTLSEDQESGAVEKQQQQQQRKDISPSQQPSSHEIVLIQNRIRDIFAEIEMLTHIADSFLHALPIVLESNVTSGGRTDVHFTRPYFLWRPQIELVPRTSFTPNACETLHLVSEASLDQRDHAATAVVRTADSTSVDLSNGYQHSAPAQLPHKFIVRGLASVYSLPEAGTTASSVSLGVGFVRSQRFLMPTRQQGLCAPLQRFSNLSVPSPSFDVDTVLGHVLPPRRMGQGAGFDNSGDAAVSRDCVPVAFTHLLMCPSFVALGSPLPSPPFSAALLDRKPVVSAGATAPCSVSALPSAEASLSTLLPTSQQNKNLSREMEREILARLAEPITRHWSGSGSTPTINTITDFVHHHPITCGNEDLVFGYMQRLAIFTQKYHKKRHEFLLHCAASDAIKAMNAADQKVSNSQNNQDCSLLFDPIVSDVSDEIAAAAVESDPAGFLLQLQWAEAGPGVVLIHDVERVERVRNHDRHRGGDFLGNREGQTIANFGVKTAIADSVKHFTLVTDAYDLGTLEQYLQLVHTAREGQFVDTCVEALTAADAKRVEKLKRARKEKAKRQQLNNVQGSGDNEALAMARSLNSTSAAVASPSSSPFSLEASHVPTNGKQKAEVPIKEYVPDYLDQTQPPISLAHIRQLLTPNVQLPANRVTVAIPHDTTTDQQHAAAASAPPPPSHIALLLPGFPADEVLRALTPIMLFMRTVAKVIASTKGAFEDEPEGAFGDFIAEALDGAKISGNDSTLRSDSATRSTAKSLRGFDKLWVEEVGGSVYDDAFLLEKLLTIDPKMIVVRRKPARNVVTAATHTPMGKAVRRSKDFTSAVPLSLDDVELALSLHTSADMLRFWAELLQKPFRDGSAARQIVSYAEELLEVSRLQEHESQHIEGGGDSRGTDGAAVPPHQEAVAQSPSSSSADDGGSPMRSKNGLMVSTLTAAGFSGGGNDGAALTSHFPPTRNTTWGEEEFNSAAATSTAAPSPSRFPHNIVQTPTSTDTVGHSFSAVGVGAVVALAGGLGSEPASSRTRTPPRSVSTNTLPDVITGGNHLGTNLPTPNYKRNRTAPSSPKTQSAQRQPQQEASSSSSEPFSPSCGVSGNNCSPSIFSTSKEAGDLFVKRLKEVLAPQLDVTNSNNAAGTAQGGGRSDIPRVPEEPSNRAIFVDSLSKIRINPSHGNSFSSGGSPPYSLLLQAAPTVASLEWSLAMISLFLCNGSRPTSVDFMVDCSDAGGGSKASSGCEYPAVFEGIVTQLSELSQSLFNPHENLTLSSPSPLSSSLMLTTASSPRVKAWVAALESIARRNAVLYTRTNTNTGSASNTAMRSRQRFSKSVDPYSTLFARLTTHAAVSRAAPCEVLSHPCWTAAMLKRAHAVVSALVQRSTAPDAEGRCLLSYRYQPPPPPMPAATSTAYDQHGLSRKASANAPDGNVDGNVNGNEPALEIPHSRSGSPTTTTATSSVSALRTTHCKSMSNECDNLSFGQQHQPNAAADEANAVAEEEAASSVLNSLLFPAAHALNTAYFLFDLASEESQHANEDDGGGGDEGTAFNLTTNTFTKQHQRKSSTGSQPATLPPHSSHSHDDNATRDANSMTAEERKKREQRRLVGAARQLALVAQVVRWAREATVQCKLLTLAMMTIWNDNIEKERIRSRCQSDQCVDETVPNDTISAGPTAVCQYPLLQQVMADDVLAAEIEERIALTKTHASDLERKGHAIGNRLSQILKKATTQKTMDRSPNAHRCFVDDESDTYYHSSSTYDHSGSRSSSSSASSANGRRQKQLPSGGGRQAALKDKTDSSTSDSFVIAEKEKAANSPLKAKHLTVLENGGGAKAAKKKSLKRVMTNASDAFSVVTTPPSSPVGRNAKRQSNKKDHSSKTKHKRNGHHAAAESSPSAPSGENAKASAQCTNATRVDKPTSSHCSQTPTPNANSSQQSPRLMPATTVSSKLSPSLAPTSTLLALSSTVASVYCPRCQKALRLSESRQSDFNEALRQFGIMTANWPTDVRKAREALVDEHLEQCDGGGGSGDEHQGGSEQGGGGGGSSASQTVTSRFLISHLRRGSDNHPSSLSSRSPLLGPSAFAANKPASDVAHTGGGSSKMLSPAAVLDDGRVMYEIMSPITLNPPNTSKDDGPRQQRYDDAAGLSAGDGSEQKQPTRGKRGGMGGRQLTVEFPKVEDMATDATAPHADSSAATATGTATGADDTTQSTATGSPLSTAMGTRQPSAALDANNNARRRHSNADGIAGKVETEETGGEESRPPPPAPAAASVSAATLHSGPVMRSRKRRSKLLIQFVAQQQADCEHHGGEGLGERTSSTGSNPSSPPPPSSSAMSKKSDGGDASAAAKSYARLAPRWQTILLHRALDCARSTALLEFMRLRKGNTSSASPANNKNDTAATKTSNNHSFGPPPPMMEALSLPPTALSFEACHNPSHQLSLHDRNRTFSSDSICGSAGGGGVCRSNVSFTATATANATPPLHPSSNQHAASVANRSANMAIPTMSASSSSAATSPETGPRPMLLYPPQQQQQHHHHRRQNSAAISPTPSHSGAIVPESRAGDDGDDERRVEDKAFLDQYLRAHRIFSLLKDDAARREAIRQKRQRARRPTRLDANIVGSNQLAARAAHWSHLPLTLQAAAAPHYPAILNTSALLSSECAAEGLPHSRSFDMSLVDHLFDHDEDAELFLSVSAMVEERAAHQGFVLGVPAVCRLRAPFADGNAGFMFSSPTDDAAGDGSASHTAHGGWSTADSQSDDRVELSSSETDNSADL